MKLSLLPALGLLAFSTGAAPPTGSTVGLIDGSGAPELRGTILDTSGDPLDGFTLTVYREEYREGGAARSTVFRRAAGNLEAALDHGVRLVALSAPGMCTHVHGVDWRRPATLLDLGEVRLSPGRAVHGRVLDGETGDAVAGARVEHFHPVVVNHVTGAGNNWRPPGFADTTDADGTFSLHGLPVDGLTIVALSEDYRRRVVHPGHDTDDVNIKLYSRAVVEGTLLRDDGAPATGTVSFRHQPRGVERLTWDRTDIVFAGRSEQVNEYGTFRFEDIESGSYRFGGESPDGAVAERTVTVGDDDASQWVELTAERRGRISGSISGLAEGETATVAVVRAAGRYSQTYLTDSDVFAEDLRDRVGPMDVAGLGNGAYRVLGVPAGQVTVLATARSESSRTLSRAVDMVAGEGWADFDFGFRSRLWGEVRVGSEVMFATTVEAVPRASGHPVGEATTDLEGRYDLSGLADGHYVLHASHQMRKRAIDVDIAGETRLDVRFGTASISGDVHVEPPGPVPWKLFAVSGDGSSYEGGTGSRGGYRFQWLDEGTYTVTTDPRHRADFPTVTLGDGEALTDVDLWVTPSETRPVTVVDGASGERLPSASVEIEDGPFAGMAFFVTDRMGLPATLSGRRLTIWRKGYLKAPFRWDGDENEVKLVPLSPAHGTSSRTGGTVSRDDGLPVVDPASDVALACANARWTTTVTMAEPGATPELVERHLVHPLERELFDVADIDGISSSALAGRAMVEIEASPGADVLDGVRQAVRRVGEQVPSALIEVLEDTVCRTVERRDRE